MTTNGRRGFVCEIGGETHLLHYDMNALCALEEATGISISEFDASKAGFRGQRALLWAGLLHEDEDWIKGRPPKLTLRQVGEWMTPLMKTPSEYSKMLLATANAYGEAFPETKPAENETNDSKNAQRAAGTGKSFSTTAPESELELQTSGT